MARVSKQDAAKAKEAKQKKIAIGGAVLLVALLAIQGPKTMKMLNQKPAPPIDAPTTATGVTPADPNSLAAPTLGGTGVTAAPAATETTSGLVAAVPVTVDAGQIETFERFASKDPFAVQVTASGGSVPEATTTTTTSSGTSKPPASSSSGGTATPTGTAPTLTTVTPPAPAPTSAVISLNGEASSVSVGSDFPTAGSTFTRAGALFHLVSLTAKTAKIAVTGGSYADGAPTITLTLGKPVTLQNTADGTKYTLLLQPPTAQVAGTTGTPPATPVVPATGSGG